MAGGEAVEARVAGSGLGPQAMAVRRPAPSREAGTGGAGQGPTRTRPHPKNAGAWGSRGEARLPTTSPGMLVAPLPGGLGCFSGVA